MQHCRERSNCWSGAKRRDLPRWQRARMSRRLWLQEIQGQRRRQRQHRHRQYRFHHRYHLRMELLLRQHKHQQFQLASERDRLPIRLSHRRSPPSLALQRPRSRCLPNWYLQHHRLNRVSRRSRQMELLLCFRRRLEFPHHNQPPRCCNRRLNNRRNRFFLPDQRLLARSLQPLQEPLLLRLGL